MYLELPGSEANCPLWTRPCSWASSWPCPCGSACPQSWSAPPAASSSAACAGPVLSLNYLLGGTVRAPRRLVGGEVLGLALLEHSKTLFVAPRFPSLSTPVTCHPAGKRQCLCACTLHVRTHRLRWGTHACASLHALLRTGGWGGVGGGRGQSVPRTASNGGRGEKRGRVACAPASLTEMDGGALALAALAPRSMRRLHWAPPRPRSAAPSSVARQACRAGGPRAGRACRHPRVARRVRVVWWARSRAGGRQQAGTGAPAGRRAHAPAGRRRRTCGRAGGRRWACAREAASGLGVILTGAGRAVDVGTAAVAASDAAGQSGRSGRVGTGEAGEKETPVSKEELQFWSFWDVWFQTP